MVAAATEIQEFTCTGGEKTGQEKTTALHKSVDLDALVRVLSPEIFITF